ncbi:DNA primase [Candidatus Marimicrobium litorale]|uniref:DNA primase n=1 Tax=Candidatus Marimicrobium litorale TaxID=2518991 RepID=A0ABT3TAJ7_9GAMM|nr:DNA primase [Candidatus Marimicrobium litorale]MCX2979215.1 DNA primase [Candidatus Marimicrobium litorale]
MPGRIPQSFLDDLLDRVDIVEVIDRRVKLKKSGKNYSARCPFHEERSPSFSVNPDKQFYYCFGCGAGGNALTFLMEYDNLEFPQAVDNLANSAGMEVPREPSRDGRDTGQREDSNKPLYALMEKVSLFYQAQLRQHSDAPRAVEYLKGRGLSGQVARDFNLGFAPPGWDSLHPALGGGEELQALLIKAGMLVQNESGRVYDRFRDRVAFPIRDRRGRVIAFGGRVLGDDKPKYLNSPETPIFQKGRELYGLYEARQTNRQLDRILVVEGYMDVIALAQHGITYATATLGTATSQIHLERIYRLCPEVVFCFDGDTAGRRAALRALEAALPSMEDGRQARFLFLPEGQDPDDAVRSGGREAFEQLMAEAVPLEDFLFESTSRNLDLNSLEGRARMSKQALPYIRQLPEGVFRQLMYQSLAERTGLELTSLMQLEVPPMNADIAQDNSVDGAESPPPYLDEVPLPEDEHSTETPPSFRHRPTPEGYSSLVQTAIALLLHQPTMARLISPAQLEGLDFEGSQLLLDLLQLLQRRPESSTAMLLGHWYGTPEGNLLNRLAGQERLIPATGIEQEFADTLLALTHLPGQNKLAAQVDKLKVTNYADVSDTEKQRLKELLQEKRARDAQRNKPAD